MVASSYAMSWCVGAGPRRAGKIELGAAGIELSATSVRRLGQCVDFARIVEVVLDRHTLRVRCDDGAVLRIESLDSPGALRELAGRVSAAATAAAAATQR